MKFLFLSLVLVLIVIPKSIWARTNMFSLGVTNAAIAVGAAAALTTIPQPDKTTWKPVRVKVPKALKSVFSSRQQKLSKFNNNNNISTTKLIDTSSTISTITPKKTIKLLF